MRTLAAVAWLLALVAAASAQKADAPPPASQPEPKIYVAVAPFRCDFDGGKWGVAATDAFYLKLVRWPATSPIDKFSYADFAAGERFEARWDTPVARVVRFAKDSLAVQIFIYGEVVRTPGGGDGDVTLRVRAIDLRQGPTLAVDREFQISHPTQLRPAVELVLNQLVGYSVINMEVPALVKLTAAMEQRWADGPNLVPNGDFESPEPADPTRLADWEIQLADQRYAPAKFDGHTAPLVTDYLRHGLWGLDPADAKNRVLHMPISEPVAATYGVACYSRWIAITPGCVYRFSYRWRLAGPTPKVFIKGYALRPTPGELDAAGKPADAEAAALKFQRREVYRRQIHPTSEADPKRDLGNGWTETTADFCPRHDQYPPHWLRIDVYAYWPKGHVWFDNVVLKQLSDKPVVEQHDPPDLPAEGPPPAARPARPAPADRR